MVHNFFVAEWQTVCFYSISFNFHSQLNENSTHEVSVQLYNPRKSGTVLSKIYYEVGEVGRLFLGLTPWNHTEKQVQQVALHFSSRKEGFCNDS